MKKIIKNRLNGILVVPFIVMFFSTGIINSQNTVQNEQQRINKTQRFIDRDTNKDGFITENEFQFSSFNQFDIDQNGKLSRKEYRKINRSFQGNTTGNAKSGKNKGHGKGKGKGKRSNEANQYDNGKNQSVTRGNCRGKASGNSSNAKQCNKGKKSKKGGGRGGSL